jgi:serine/threonine protein kinase
MVSERKNRFRNDDGNGTIPGMSAEDPSTLGTVADATGRDTLTPVAALDDSPGGDSSVAAERAASRDAAEDRVGSRLGKYLLTGVLGRGGMGVVYEAENTLLKRKVAVKILPDAFARKPDALKRFLMEAQAAARLDHPNVVGIYDIDGIDGVYFIAMQLVRGVSAGEFIAQRGPFNWPEATRVIADACRGLAAAHDAGLVHRDIKPSNIMRGLDGTVKLADFGLAVRVGKDGTAPERGLVMGTPPYMSPEQSRGGPVDFRSDVFSLGAAYLTLLVGKPPFDGIAKVLDKVRAKGQPGVGGGPRIALPEACLEIIARAIAELPADRFPDARSMLAALESALPGGSAWPDLSVWHDSSGPVPAPAAPRPAMIPEHNASSGRHPTPRPPAGPSRRPAGSSASSGSPASSSSAPGSSSSGSSSHGSPSHGSPSHGSSGSSSSAPPPSAPGPRSGSDSANRRPGARGAPRSAARSRPASSGTAVRPGSGAGRFVGWGLMVLGVSAAVAVTLLRGIGGGGAAEPTAKLAAEPSTVTPTPPAPSDDPAPLPLPLGPGSSDPSPGAVPDPARDPALSDGEEPPPEAGPERTVRMAESADLHGWTRESGEWTLRDVVLTAARSDRRARLSADLPPGGLDLTVTMAPAPGDEPIAVEFGHGSSGNCLLTLAADGTMRLTGFSGGSAEVLDRGKAGDGPRRIRLVHEGRRVRVWCDGRRVLSSPTAPAAAAGHHTRLVLVAPPAGGTFRDLGWATPVTAPDPGLRHLARALAGFRPSDAADRLAGWLGHERTPKSVTDDLIRALAAVGGPSAVKALTAAAARDDLPPAAVAALLDGLAASAPGSAAAAEAVERRLSHREAVVRAAAVAAMARINPKASARLVSAADDREPAVRSAALSAMARLREPAAVPKLVAALSDPEVREAAVLGLLEFPDRRDEALAGVLTGLELGGQVRDACRQFVEGRTESLEPLVRAAARAGRLSPHTLGELRPLFSGLRAPAAWRVIGPMGIRRDGRDHFDVAEVSARSDFSRPVMLGDKRKFEWRNTCPDERGEVNLAPLFPSGDQRWSAYAAADFALDADGPVELEVSGDDDVTIWLNGRRVGEATLAETRTGTKKFRAAGAKGRNVLMVRCDNGGGGHWFFRVRYTVRSPSGELAGPEVLDLLGAGTWLAGRVHYGQGWVAAKPTGGIDGGSHLKVGGSQDNARIPHWNFPIAEHPGPGQYRYLTFAWKKAGGEQCRLRLAADGKFDDNKDGPVRGYYAGKGNGGVRLAEEIPSEWQVHTVDLFKDFGAFTLTGIRFGFVDGEHLMVDRMFLARSRAGVDRLKGPRGKGG